MRSDELDFYDGHFGVWRTVGGRHIFIREGEPLDEAMQRSGKFTDNRSYKKEFSKLVKCDEPKLVTDENYVEKTHKGDIDVGNWIKDTFHTKVKLLNESNVNSELKVDSIINDSLYCEFKNFSSKRSIETQLRRAKKQLVSMNATKDNAVIHMKSMGNLSIEEIWNEVDRQIKVHYYFSVIVIVQKEYYFDVRKYK